MNPTRTVPLATLLVLLCVSPVTAGSFVDTRKMLLVK